MNQMRDYNRIATFPETVGGWKMGVNGEKWGENAQKVEKMVKMDTILAIKLAVGISIAVWDQFYVKTIVTTFPWDVTSCKIGKYRRIWPKTAKKRGNSPILLTVSHYLVNGPCANCCKTTKPHCTLKKIVKITERTLSHTLGDV